MQADADRDTIEVASFADLGPDQEIIRSLNKDTKNSAKLIDENN